MKIGRPARNRDPGPRLALVVTEIHSSDLINSFCEPQQFLEKVLVPPLVLINAVGLTTRLLPHAPQLHKLSQTGWVRPLREVAPAVTCTAQATLLTGVTPD